jgi:hypothetical protein
LRRLAEPVSIDAGNLSENDRQGLEQLIRDARFFELPARLPAPRGIYDRAYQITIEDRGRRHTISFSEPVSGPALQKLDTRLRYFAENSGF